MPYYKFKTNNVYRNTLKTHPSVKFIVYSGSAYYNNTPNISGAHADPIRLTDSGHISLYEMNIDRVSSSTDRFIGAQVPLSGEDAITGVPDNGLIYSFVVKNSSRLGFRTLASTGSWNEAQYGQVIFGNYPYTSSISKEFYAAATPRSSSNPLITNGVRTGSVSHILALKNTIDSYTYINPHFIYSSSEGALYPGAGRDFNSIDLGLVNIPTIFYGSAIKKGTIDLKYYITGALLARAQDENQDGVLYGTYGRTSGSAIGLALYNEGFIILTSSLNLSRIDKDYYTSSSGLTSPRWLFFAQSLSGSVLGTVGDDLGPGIDPTVGPITAASASFVMEMSGTSTTQTLTMFANAPKGQLNQSTNPTFIKYTTANFANTGSKTYVENDQMLIKNVVSSAYADPTGSFQKVTYISKVGIYDNSKNLIAIAKLATPIKKTVERDFTFKIKLDI